MILWACPRPPNAEHFPPCPQPPQTYLSQLAALQPTLPCSPACFLGILELDNWARQSFVPTLHSNCRLQIRVTLKDEGVLSTLSSYFLPPASDTGYQHCPPLAECLLLEACCPPSTSPTAPGSHLADGLNSVILYKEDIEGNTKTRAAAPQQWFGAPQAPSRSQQK